MRFVVEQAKDCKNCHATIFLAVEDTSAADDCVFDQLLNSEKCRAKQARQVCDPVDTDIDSATLRDLQGPFQTSLRNRSPLRPFSLSSSKSEIKKRKRRQNYRDATKQIGDDDSRVSHRHFPQFLQHHPFLKVSI